MNTLLTQDDSAWVRHEYLEYMKMGVGRITEQLRPTLSIDGNKWCAMYGSNPMEGVCGFGDTPIQAINDWEKNFYSQRLK